MAAGQRVRINRRSNLVHAFIFQVGDTSFWTRSEVPQILPDTDDRRYTVQAQDTLDNLAARFYGDPELLWVLKRANGIWLEPNQLIPDTELVIPSITRLRRQGVIPG